MTAKDPAISRKGYPERRDLGDCSIVAVGAHGPLGLNALQVTTAARAGKREIRASSMRDRKDQSVGLVYARFLPEDLFGPERLARLAAPALSEVARPLSASVPLVLGLGEPERPDLPTGIEGEIIARLRLASGAALNVSASQVIRAGNASFAFALKAALDLLAQGAPAVIAGCVDSYVHPEAITWLDEAFRLHAAGTEDGIIPAEGAAFVLLMPGNGTTSSVLRSPIPKPLAVVRRVSTEYEISAVDPDAPILATAATSVVQTAIAACRAVPAWLMTDINEMHRLREWSRVEMRCHPAFASAEHVRLPDLFGDTGAATGALGAIYACQGWSLGGAPRGTLVIALAASGSPRGAITLEEAAG